MEPAIATNRRSEQDRDPVVVCSWSAAEVIAANSEPAAASRGLTLSEKLVIDAFRQIAAVDAVYCDRDQEGVLMVFVVVREHDEAVYEEVLRAEESLVQTCPDPIELRVRAHQGRNPRRAVPIGTLPLFLRD